MGSSTTTARNMNDCPWIDAQEVEALAARYQHRNSGESLDFTAAR